MTTLNGYMMSKQKELIREIRRQNSMAYARLGSVSDDKLRLSLQNVRKLHCEP